MRSQESKYKYIRGLNIEPGNTAFLKKKKKARAIKKEPEEAENTQFYPESEGKKGFKDRIISQTKCGHLH